MSDWSSCAEEVLLQKALISIVDDNAPILAAMRALVRSMGFKVEIFSSAREFLSSPKALEKSGCLIVDFQMPEMTGIELFQRLNALNIHIPTILMTAYSTPAIVAKAEQVGIMCCFSKPLDSDQLSDRIREAIRSGRE
jgi:FixJ family two-component response regulator